MLQKCQTSILKYIILRLKLPYKIWNYIISFLLEVHLYLIRKYSVYDPLLLNLSAFSHYYIKNETVHLMASGMVQTTC